MPSFETCLLFSFLTYDLSERKMEEEKVSESSNVELGEKCKAALQKSWGIDIPMPKAFGKKPNMQ